MILVDVNFYPIKLVFNTDFEQELYLVILLKFLVSFIPSRAVVSPWHSLVVIVSTLTFGMSIRTVSFSKFKGETRE